ncbi:MAG: hypothetical protein SOZ62_02585 [Eubacteriales bacterium]|nr:hypothetical protein [Eubacteriales bacterium]
MKVYRSEYVKKLLDYTSLRRTAEGRVRTLIGEGLPSLTKFASMINVTRATLNVWAAENEEFAIAMEEAKARICDVIKDAAALKYIDSSFSKFLLTAEYGYGEEAKDSDNVPFDVNVTVVKE